MNDSRDFNTKATKTAKAAAGADDGPTACACALGEFRPLRLLAFVVTGAALLAAILLLGDRQRRGGADDGRDYELAIREDRALVAGVTMGRIPFSAVLTAGPEVKETIAASADGIYDALSRVSASMNAYDAASDLGRLNAAPAGQAVALAPELYDLLKRARTLTEQTGGAFDPTARPLYELWKTRTREGRTPDAAEIAAAMAHGGWSHFAFDDGARCVRKDDHAAQIDLGAIAKGYAADRAAAAAAAGRGEIVGELVEVGGEVSVLGRSPSQTGRWTLGLSNPYAPDGDEGAPGLCGVLRLPAGGRFGVATSGDYRRSGEVAGHRYNHIVDPRTGRPVEDVHSVTVIASSAEQADALATALTVMGEAGFEPLAALEGVELLMISGPSEAPRVKMTPGIEAMLPAPLNFALQSQDQR